MIKPCDHVSGRQRPRRRPRCLCCRSVLFLALGYLSSGPWAGAARADDVQVNTYTTSAQRLPALATDAAGDFVVVWESYGSSGTDASDTSIQGQRYASDGSTVGGEFQINTYTTDHQHLSAVAMDAAGNFVVVWFSDGSSGTDSSDYSVQGQRFASDGSAVGGEFQVNTYTTGHQAYPSVSMTSAGDFVVAWVSEGSSGTDGSSRSVQGQRFASDGSTIGGEFQVNTYTTSYQGAVTVAVDADGDFVVVWASAGSSGTDSSFESLQGQRFASDGSAAGGEFQINTYTTGGQFRSSVAVSAGGDFVAVWESDGSGGTDSQGSSIQARRYASDGAPVGDQLQVNTYTRSNQVVPVVALGAAGEFVVVWSSFGSDSTDTSHFSIQGQRYASDGSTVSGQFQVNSYTTDVQLFQALTMDASGDFVVAWGSYGSDGTDTDGYSVQKARVSPIFADGFESGDTSSWSATTTP